MLLTGPQLPGSGLKMCAGCRQVAYCSKACQKKKWSKHKLKCAELRAAGVGPPAAGPSAVLRQAPLTAHQLQVLQTLQERHDAQDHRGIVHLMVEASEVAVAIRTTNQSKSAGISWLLGQGHMQVQLYQDAIMLLKTAMPMYEEIRKSEILANHKTNDRHRLCSVCGDLATCYRVTGHCEKALVLLDRALAMAEEAGNRRELGRVMTNLGGLCQQLGQHDRAIGLLDQSLAIAREVGDQQGQGDSCHNLALCYKAMGQYEKVVTLSEQSVVIFEANGDYFNLMQACKGLGLCLARLGNYAQAIKLHTKHWALSQQLGDMEHQAEAALNIGVTLWTQGLAEHYEAIAAADSADGGLRMKKQSSERVVEAQQWLKTAMHCNTGVEHGVTVCIVKTIGLDATLNLACLTFFTRQEAQALKYLQAHLETCVQEARELCAGCWQRRGEDVPMLRCGGCKVARSVLHLLTPSLPQHRPCVQLLYPNKLPPSRITIHHCNLITFYCKNTTFGCDAHMVVIGICNLCQ